MAAQSETKRFTSGTRKTLFLELAASADGTTPLEVHRRAKELDDTVTEEAYYNLARRLVHRGLLVSTSIDRNGQGH
jgi:hypothetical protein